MKTITTEEVQNRINDEVEIVLFWHTDNDLVTKSLTYNFQTGEYIVHTKNGCGITKDMLTAVRMYNTEEIPVSLLVS